ncbi:MAG: hypothetical protein KAQ79_13040, partial [Cyclobacteriaceae bacterium]|nr:hypothetical protein [Cyclobacteriaceae bacterium]
MIKKKTIMLLALGTLIVFGGLGIALIPYVRNMEIDAFFMGTEPIWLQVLVGIVFGIVTAMAGWQIVELPI